MAASIYELCGKGLRGSPVMCHLVALGAHDGRPGRRAYQMRKIGPNNLKQYRSWFDPASRAWIFDGHPIVGQVFFPFADKSLDGITDRIVLDAVVAWYRFELGQRNRVELDFVGHADPRGAPSFNEKLARKRAEVVQRHVDRGIRTNFVERVNFFRYKSKAESLGETMPTGDNAADRRVDIVLRSVTVKSVVEEADPLLVTAEYKGPLTKKLLFRPWGGVGGGIGKIGVETLEIEIKNPKSGATAFYQYYGGSFGIGLPVSGSLPSADYEAKEVPFGFVDVDDFEGAGSIDTAMVGGGVQCLIFAGPKLHHSKKIIKKDGVEFCFPGWDLQVGASMGAGYWSRCPYRTEKERQDYLAKKAEEKGKRDLDRSTWPKL